MRTLLRPNLMIWPSFQAAQYLRLVRSGQYTIPCAWQPEDLTSLCKKRALKLRKAIGVSFHKNYLAQWC